MVNKGDFSGEYAEEARKANRWNRPGEGEKDKAKKPATTKEYITMIVGGPEGGDTASQRKNWARSLNVATVSAEPRTKNTKREPITFSDRDLPHTGEDHNDPLVITMDINGADVARVLVDTWSSVNVLYLETFKKLKLDRSQLEPLQTPLSRFTGATIEAEGTITLPVELGTCSKVVSKRMKFVVVDIHCVHNAILGRPGINHVRAIISMTHLCMKFYTPHGIGEERGDQRNARSCYLEAVKKMTRLFERIKVISQQVEKGEEKQRLEPDSSTEEVQIDSAIPERGVRIGTGLPVEQKDAIIQVLTRYNSLFAWSVADMPRIDRSVICHRLSVMEGSHPVRQKKRYLASERREFVKKEVKDLLGALNGAESWYTSMEKAGYALFITAKKLASYFQAHPIVVLTDQPLGMVIRNSTSSGRMIKWAMMLTQFNIEYRPRTAIKGQAVADFLVEMTGHKEEEHEKVITESWWTMSVDGASGPKGYGGGVVFTTPEGFKVYHALIFKFKLTNNEAEYEALIGGLRLAKSLHVSRLVIKSDSSLVVGHVNGNMEAKGEKMQQYRDLKCPSCQIFYKFPGRPATYYHPVSNIVPFARFGLHIVRAFHVAQASKKYVVVAIDYFTKWVEAEAYATITTKQCQKFVWQDIITRFGAPRSIVSDNGPQFRNPCFTKYLEDFGITHNKASVAYPQGNGQVENANRTIVDGIKKRLGKAKKNWLEELPHIIWAYRVTSRRATGETPFALTYGCEARLPIEAKIPTFREAEYNEEENNESHMAELNMVEERRAMAEMKMMEYQ
ncbi:unnamed protein product [Cuscuta campestris]|uniref:Integrase catalytic domain-containing protein n=1 Tax=Cuscuta campestris TaxID=132261 RepID=A0A484L3P7_9ASTE|nr:unnamed protein product [Cuscuta campestris]